MELLMEVRWDPANCRWSVSSRAHGAAGWVTHDGAEDELDDLLALARDTITGG